MPRTLATSLLPLEHGLHLEDVTIGPDQIVATVVTTSPRGTCPVCGTWSEAVHSLYQRTITDLPWGRQTVRLHLRVRKFFCRQPTCVRRVFTERLPTVVAPYARRTTRLTEVVRLLAFALGGEPGARIVKRLGMAASPATLLRLIRRTAVVAAPTLRVLGVDDWAFRKGHRYGTILVDLEQRRIVEVLPARNAEPLVDWLQAHPGVEVVNRDRAPAYAEAARKGVPQAVQVADRWHLIHNLVEALERCLLHFRPALKAATGMGESLLGPLPSSSETELVPWQQRVEAASQQKHAITVERYEQMRTLRAAGFTVLDIAQMVGATRRTVYRYLALDAPPERQRPRRFGHRGKAADGIEVAEALGWLGKLAEEWNVAVVLIDQVKKGGATGVSRGTAAHADSLQKEYEADAVLHVERDRDEVGRGIGAARVYVGKRRAGDSGPSFSFEVRDVNGGAAPIWIEEIAVASSAPKPKPSNERVWAALDAAMASTPDEVRERVNKDGGATLGVGTVKNALSNLGKEGRAENAGRGQWRRLSSSSSSVVGDDDGDDGATNVADEEARQLPL